MALHIKTKRKKMILNGEAIRKAREEIRIGNKKMTLDTLRDLLKREGIARSYSIIWGWENGNMQPQDPEIVAEKLAKIFHKKREFFLTEPKELKQTSYTTIK